MRELINTSALPEKHLPRKYASWIKIWDFASTFDAKSEFLEDPKPWGFGDISESSTVQEIRAAFYSEWRRYNHRGYDPDQNELKLAWIAIELLRSKLKADP